MTMIPYKLTRKEILRQLFRLMRGATITELKQAVRDYERYEHGHKR